MCSYPCVQDYCWEDHGYSLVNRLYPDVGQLIDEKFHIAYNLTYNTMAMHKDVDTSMLRRAIWNYIHCMFGIRLVYFLMFIKSYSSLGMYNTLFNRSPPPPLPQELIFCFLGLTEPLHCS